MMVANVFEEISPPRYGRKLLQTNSTTQPSFIALLCIISILTVALVITVLILCYRYYSHRERKLKKRYKHRQKFPRIVSRPNYQPSTVPISITPTSASSYSVRSSEHLFSNQHRQNVSVSALPSRRLQQSIIDAYLNDLHSLQPATIDVNQLKPYLFIDLHSTSSETFPENISKQFLNNTSTSGYNTSTEDESQRKYRYYHKHQQRRRSTLASKGAYHSRFLVRERSLPNHSHQLPQLRQMTTQQQRHLFGQDDTNNSSSTMINPDLLSTTVSTTTEDYDDSHIYNVHQHQMMQTIKEEKLFIVQQHFPYMSLDYQPGPYFFEKVSTSRDDYSDIHTPYKSSPMTDNRIAYINESIVV